MTLATHHEQQLVGMGDCPLHYHLDDRTPTHSTLNELQAISLQQTVTASTTLTYDSDYVLANTTSGNITLTLPAAKFGKELVIVKTAAANTLTLTPDGTDTILGETDASVTIQWTALHLKATTGNWIAI